MPTPTFTIKIKAGSALMDRIRNVAGYLDVTPAKFVEHAIESELRHQEAHQIKEDITLEELRKNVLSSGQSLEFSVDSEEGGVHYCDLCMKALPESGGFEGPTLCEECHNLAQGAQLEKLEQSKP